MLTLAWLNVLRILRGWRWKAAALASIAGSYWFGRGASFGEGSATWFSGERAGVLGFTLFIALAGLVFGIDALGQWNRHRAATHLQTRLVRPHRFLFANALAIVSALVPLAFIVEFWAPVGAWRADLLVFWSPNLVHFAAVLLPILICSVNAGMLARTLSDNDLGALFVGVLVLLPVAYFRTVTAPSLEFFELGGLSLGILIPTGMVLREAAITIAYACLPLGIACLLLPHTRGRTMVRSAERFFTLKTPFILSFLSGARAQIRQWSGATFLYAGLAIAIGGWALAEITARMQLPVGDIAWGEVTSPPGTVAGSIPPVEIVSRKARLVDGPLDGISVVLDIRATTGTQTLAAFTFGDSFIPASVVDGYETTVYPSVLGSGQPYVAIGFEHPLSAGDTRTVEIQLVPRPEARRLAERIWNPQFRRLAPLGEWWGESVRVNYNTAAVEILPQAAPFELDLPDPSPLSWVAGSAHAKRSGDRVILKQPLPGMPSQLMAAALVRIDPPTPETLNVSFLVAPERRNLAENFYRIYGEMFQRIVRVLGPSPVSLTFYELPEQTPQDPMAIPSMTLDRFQLLLRDYAEYGTSTAWEFERFAPNLNRAIVEEYVDKSFSGFENRLLLRDGLIEYLSLYALGQGLPAESYRIRRVDIALVPWPSVRRSRFPFDPPGEAGWEGSIDPAKRAIGAPPVSPLRAVAFHHILRGAIGDEAWREGLHRLFHDFRGQRLTIDRYRQVMEESSGDNLSRFFSEWLTEGVLPKYRILSAQAFLTENSETRALEYRTEVTLRNDGTGTLEVPWELATEEEPLSGRILLPPGESRQLSLRTLDRPVVFGLDPEGWIPRVRTRDADKKQPRPQVLFKTITEI